MTMRAVGLLAIWMSISGCSAHVGAGVSIGDDPTAAAPPAASLCCSGTYAAMAEVPAVGGELRLVEIETIPASAAVPEQQAIAFPLQHTDVSVRVAEMMAVYTVTQTFENPFVQ